jgi:hypothetical protein
MYNVAKATENGLTEYPIGADTILPGILPSPGKTEFYNYSLLYAVPASIGPGGVKAPDFHATVLADAVRVVHTWDFMVGPFMVSTSAVQPFIHAGLTVDGLKDQATGIGDSNFAPVYLGYQSADHTLFAWAGVDYFFPTGSFDKTNLVNIGLNYYTIVPNGAVTWFTTPKLQMSLKYLFEFHTINTATRYRSGDTFDLDYSAEYAVLDNCPNLHLGIQGYFFQQLSNDTLNGRVLLDGYRGQAFAIGPQIRWDLPGGAIAGKWQHEVEAQNRTRGDKFWIQFALPLPL